MKIPKSKIQLSETHPTLLLDLSPTASSFHFPVLISKDLVLIDGYRRYQIHPESEIEAIQVEAENILEAAYEANLNTRAWDETDCFLWYRWARHLSHSASKLPMHEFEAPLFEVELPILRLLAQRSLHFRQFSAIARLPVTYHWFFAKFLTNTIQLNPNETHQFIEIALDLRKIQKIPSLQQLFQSPALAEIIQNSEQTRKQKGERLLKEMRILRYPYYHKRSELFSTYWQQLNIGQNISLKKSLFLERGLLELTITASSPEEFREKLQRLCETSNSPLWNKSGEE
jgi:hypothetical protein